MGKASDRSTSKLGDFPNDPTQQAGEKFPVSNHKETISAEKKEPASIGTSGDSQKKPKILLVEDNWEHAYLVITYLNKGGCYHVEQASSGSEALYKLAGGRFSLVLLDYYMSGMTGLDLIKRIKELNYNLPIIMLTGLGSEPVAVEAMKNGAYDYIVKSGNFLDILPFRIDQALERRELEKRKEEWDRWIFKRNLDLSALNCISTALGKSIKIEEVLREAVSKTVEVLRAHYGQILLMEEIAASACLYAQQTAEASPGTGVKSSAISLNGPSKEFLQQVMQGGESSVLEDTTVAPGLHRQESSKEALRSLAYLPLKSKENALGVLILGSYRKLHFTKEDVKLLNAVGNQIGYALENARLYEEIKSQAERIKDLKFDHEKRALACHVIR